MTCSPCSDDLINNYIKEFKLEKVYNKYNNIIIESKKYHIINSFINFLNAKNDNAKIKKIMQYYENYVIINDVCNINNGYFIYGEHIKLKNILKNNNSCVNDTMMINMNISSNVNIKIYDCIDDNIKLVAIGKNIFIPIILSFLLDHFIMHIDYKFDFSDNDPIIPYIKVSYTFFSSKYIDSPKNIRSYMYDCISNHGETNEEQTTMLYLNNDIGNSTYILFDNILDSANILNTFLFYYNQMLHNT